MKFVTIDENSKWLSAVQKLGDDSRLTLSFMPAQAFVDYAKRKQILGLIINGELVAYTMFRYKKTSLIMVHFCVSTKHRGHGYAKKLMSALYQQEKDYVSQFMLSCRRDYNLDKFWYSLGFAPMAEKPGRASKSNSILTTWIRPNPECQSLFTTAFDNNAEKIRAILDSNIVIALCSENEIEVNALTQDFLRACLKSPRTRLGGIFSALTALKILAIRQDAAAFCLAGQKTYLTNPHTLRY